MGEIDQLPLRKIRGADRRGVACIPLVIALERVVALSKARHVHLMKRYRSGENEMKTCKVFEPPTTHGQLETDRIDHARKRHGIEGKDEVLKALAGALDAIISKALE